MDNYLTTSENNAALVSTSKDETIAGMKKQLEWYNKKYGPYIEKRGLRNWKNLLRKPTLLEWTILFMLTLTLFSAWAYKHDVLACQDTLNNLEATACQICQTKTEINEKNNQLQAKQEEILANINFSSIIPNRGG